MLWPVLNGFSIPRFSRDSILSTTLCEDYICCSMRHYNIAIGNDVARDLRCEIIGHDFIIGIYPDVTMHTDVAGTHHLLCITTPNDDIVYSNLI